MTFVEHHIFSDLLGVEFFILSRICSKVAQKRFKNRFSISDLENLIEYQSEEQASHSVFLSITTLPEPVLLCREVTALERTPDIFSLLAAIVADTSETTSFPGNMCHTTLTMDLTLLNLLP